MTATNQAIDRYDALVVGGGLAGLPFAIALASAGLDVAVVDQAEPADTIEPAFDGRVLAIALAPKRLLEAIGMWRHLREAEPILDIRVSDGRAPLFLHYDHRDVGDAPFGWMVENRLNRMALFARMAELPNLHYVAPDTIARLERTAERVTADLTSGRRLTAQLCVAADGRASPTRHAAGIKLVSWSYHQTGIVCTVAHERPHQGVAHEHFLPAGPFAILPMTGNRSSLVWTEPTERAKALMALDDDAFNWEMRRRFGGHLGAAEVVGPRWSYPFTLQHARTYVGERLALIADAAHGMHPVAGQGLNAGLRDVAVLAELVVEAKRLGLDLGSPQLLAAYQRRRYPDNTLMLAVTDAIVKLFSNDAWPLRIARDAGLAVVDRLPPLKRVFMRHAMGTLGQLPKLLQGHSL